jgi:hypothetical protein
MGYNSRFKGLSRKRGNFISVIKVKVVTQNEEKIRFHEIGYFVKTEGIFV